MLPCYSMDEDISDEVRESQTQSISMLGTT